MESAIKFSGILLHILRKSHGECNYARKVLDELIVKMLHQLFSNKKEAKEMRGGNWIRKKTQEESEDPRQINMFSSPLKSSFWFQNKQSWFFSSQLIQFWQLNFHRRHHDVVSNCFRWSGLEPLNFLSSSSWQERNNITSSQNHNNHNHTCW